MHFYSFSERKKRKYAAYLELWIRYLILPFSPVTDENRTDIDSETTFWFDFCVHTIWILLKGKIRCKIVSYDHTFNQRLKWQVIALFIKVNVKSQFLCIFCNFKVNFPIVPVDVYEWVIVVQCQVSNFSAISWREQFTFWWDDEDASFVLDQHP